MPNPTGPHVLCQARNLYLNFAGMGARECLPWCNCSAIATEAIKCPRSRPGYQCDGAATFQGYHKGALLGYGCERQETFVSDRFPRDHLRDVFDSFEISKGW